MLNLDFSEEQDMLRDMVRGVCAEYAPLDVVRWATMHGAECMGLGDELGTIAAGKGRRRRALGAAR